MSEGAPIGWIREVVLNSPKPWDLARFWSRLLGSVPVEWHPGWVTLEPPPHGQRLSFQASTAAQSYSTCQIHFDVLVEDLDQAHEQVTANGGTFLSEHLSPRPDLDGKPILWRVFQDPDGHPFCLVVH